MFVIYDQQAVHRLDSTQRSDTLLHPCRIYKDSDWHDNTAMVLSSTAFRRRRSTIIRRHADLYLLLVPGLVWVAVFRLAPILGNVIAFQDFSVFQGVGQSPWVGVSNFARLFRSLGFLSALRNTLIISTLMIAFVTPLPAVLAIMLNEIRALAFRKVTQTILFLPHFLSWVIVSGIIVNVLSSSGIVNTVIARLGGSPIPFLISRPHFRSVLVWSHAWKNVGYASIVYLAAIAAIDPSLYEAATVDGANRWMQIVHVTLPGIIPTVILLYILRVGNVLVVAREQVLMLYNPVVYEVGDVLETFVYRVGLGQLEYSFAAAAGLFNSVVSFLLIFGGNHIARARFGRSIW